MAARQRTSILARRYSLPMFAYGAAVVGMIVVGTAVVWWSGGTKTALPHVLYFPVVLAALVYGARGAIGAGLLAGLAIGPLMPLDIVAAQPQPALGWIVRIVFLVGVGLLVAGGRRHLLGLVANRQRFVSAISHEVRTPLAGILGFAQLLAARYDELPDAERREFATLIHHEVTALSDIVDGYIIAARLDDSALVIDPRYIDLRTLAREVVAGFPGPHQVSVQASDRLVTCWADPLRVRQILRAVLANVMAYGGQAVTIQPRLTERNAVVTVNAKGARISSSLEGSLLDAQEGVGPQTRIRPVGMGLAVPARLAELMGGRLTLRSGDDGMRLEVTLPIAPGDGPQRRQPIAS